MGIMGRGVWAMLKDEYACMGRQRASYLLTVTLTKQPSRALTFLMPFLLKHSNC